MSNTSLYKEILMDHYRHPRNREALEGADVIQRGNNPRCGDEVEVGVNWDGDMLVQVRFRARGCAICIASASIMSEAVKGHSKTDTSELCESMKNWVEQGSDEMPEPHELIQGLEAVRKTPSRKRCVMIAWEALSECIET
ncbi:MAG: Fe-S cluster assembly sulfur transfer protein SufU [Pseudomonadota bacterium]